MGDLIVILQMELKKFWFGNVDLYTLPGRFWKWRVRGASFEFLQRITKSSLKNMMRC